jgi:hypothetical protein
VGRPYQTLTFPSASPHRHVEARGEPKQSELETFVRHTIATHTEMGRKGKGTAAFVDVRARCLA